jgi:hypothetical protein
MSIVTNNGERYFITADYTGVVRQKLDHLPDTKYCIKNDILYYTSVIDGYHWIMEDGVTFENTRIPCYTEIDSFYIGDKGFYVAYEDKVNIYNDNNISTVDLPIKNINDNNIIQLMVRKNNKKELHTYIYHDGVIYRHMTDAYFMNSRFNRYKHLTDIKYFISFRTMYAKDYSCRLDYPGYLYINNNDKVIYDNSIAYHKMYNLAKIEPTNESLINLNKQLSYAKFDNGQLFYCMGNMYGIIDDRVVLLSTIDSAEFIGKKIYHDGIYSNPDNKYVVVNSHMVKLMDGDILVFN